MITDTLLADLHSHTTASDGRLTPAELVARALEQGVQMLAITDHDTVDGLQSAHEFNLAQSEPLRLINGVEISTRWHHFDIHVVGLNLDVSQPALLEFLEKQRLLREERAREIGERLAKAGIDGAYDAARQLAGNAAISRGHFARFLVDAGHAPNTMAVFKRYLARGKTGYVPNNWADIATAIRIIHDAGGVAVMAHPSAYKLSAKWLKRLLREFKEAGGDAMEVVMGQQTSDDRVLMAALSIQKGLLASVGSDFHFPGHWIELGKNLHRAKGLSWVWESDKWETRA
ncbi:MAG: PHP domain-containing protein [Shewanella sp.]|nr:PHP domain-containing protein [Shewanella sp.]MCF1429722.1 PHP domain-containing protein [Shewanella sp.]MCF1438312.1 PHP domain-containing protein [Shewanella sp.]MCF1457876.1 PHP domain-containing protein [Shewanella sp.]